MTSLLESVRRRELGALRLVREDSFFAPGDYPDETFLCGSPKLVFQFMEPYAKREETEVFWILALNAQHRVIRNRPFTVTRGLLNSTLVHPREIFRLAIHVNAAAVILVHNHPSGDPTPSADDRAVTAQLVAAGRLLDMPVADHVVIGRGRYSSFAEGGLLELSRRWNSESSIGVVAVKPRLGPIARLRKALERGSNSLFIDP
jgi:hypothetical protein